MPLPALSAQQQQMPQSQSERLKCGEVYTWDCAGEMYAVECALCEERPLYTLSEFAEHMEVWHSDWAEEDEEQHFLRMSMAAPKATLARQGMLSLNAQQEAELNDQICCASEVVEDLRQHDDDDMLSDEYPEPFEQVLIADDSESEAANNVDGDSLLDESAFETTDDDEHHKLMPQTVEETADLAINSWKNKHDHEQNESKEFNVNEREPNDAATEAEQYDVVFKEAKNSTCPQNEFKESRNSRELGNGIWAKMLADDFLLNDREVSDSSQSHTPAQFSSETTSHPNRNESPSKLTTDQVATLIDLYKEHPRLWCQTHFEFSETQLNRQSWLEITQKWNQHCQKNFSPTDIRIRISTLCQRYLKERDRLHLNDESYDKAKFSHYERLKFLDQEQPLQRRRCFLEKQNAKLLETYRHFPILWNSSQRRFKCPDQRKEALCTISNALKLCDIHLSPESVHRRLHTLRQSYRLEKIRHLHCQVERTTFETSFRHYEQMRFLEPHIDPYVCRVCRRIFKTFGNYREHFAAEHHDLCLETLLEEEEQPPQEVCEEFATNVGNDNGILGLLEAEVSEVVEGIIHNDTTEASDQLKGAEEKREDNLSNVDTASSCMDVVNRRPSELNEVIEITEMEPSETLIAKVECAGFTYDLQLVPFPSKNDKSAEHNEVKSNARLTVDQTHKLITLYQLQPQLWDPSHENYNSRKVRRIAWRTVTARLNRICGTRYAWKAVHRKLSDYAKYYKREKQRVEEAERCGSKWCFYDDFAFMDGVLNGNADLQSLQQKEINLRIIALYERHTPLWDTKHPDYTKRKQRQHHIETMCVRLLEDHDVQIMPERLRQRLADFRCSYRAAKRERIAAERRNERYSAPYEFYDELHFLEPHVAPFDCGYCAMSFTRRTDCLLHERKQHATDNGARGRRRTTRATHVALDNVCHICGLKFTLRSNLVNHLKRHLGHRTHACATCPKAFFNSTALRVHERSHTKEFACVCDQCGRTFVSGSKLNQHMKRHRGQRDFACDQCEKTFYSAFERDRHVRRHLNIRDKVCPVCGKTFVVGSAYYAHMLIHDEVKRYACSACDLRFAQYAGLYKHRKRYHPTD